ncbi:MAG: cation diffusion facilitator family transporter [Acidimicrobiales bacterium]
MSRSRRLSVALGLNVVLVAAQLMFGIAARSLGLLADAGHNLSDVAAVVVSLVPVHWARRSPTAARSYGYHRGTILAALANAAVILAATCFIIYEGVRRLADPSRFVAGWSWPWRWPRSPSTPWRRWSSGTRAPTSTCGPPCCTWPAMPSRPSAGVETVHDLHVWSLSSEVRALSAHVVRAGRPTLAEAQVVGERLKTVVSRPFTIAHSTLNWSA